MGFAKIETSKSWKTGGKDGVLQDLPEELGGFAVNRSEMVKIAGARALERCSPRERKCKVFLSPGTPLFIVGASLSKRSAGNEEVRR
jgi:hypothetical protein